MNNDIHTIGTVQDDFIISHTYNNELFYKTYLSVKRDSGTEDTIILIISENNIDVKDYSIGDSVEVFGEIRTRNYEGKVYVYVFVNNIVHTEDPDTNEVELWGYLCKTPKYRTTPAGREITDIILSVKRYYERLDYIPCIVWGREGKKLLKCTDKDLLYINGRLQSREYYKCNEVKVAYEVSINGVEIYDRDIITGDTGFNKIMSG